MKQQNQFVAEDILIPHFGKDANLVGVEIGVAGGDGSLGMLLRMPNLTLYSIDPWIHIPGAPFECSFSQEVHDTGYQITKDRLSDFGERSIILRMTSDEALSKIQDKVDFVYIDGHHTLEQVRKDIQNYLPKVRKGGIISGHDYVQVPDVKIAVDEFFSADQINTGDDFTWYVFV